MLFTGISFLSGIDHFVNDCNKILLLASIILSAEFQCVSGGFNDVRADAIWRSVLGGRRQPGALKPKIPSQGAFGC